MSVTKIPPKIEQQAAYWYVRLRSPELTPEQESEFFAWLESSSLHQAAFIHMDQAWVASAAVKTCRRFVWSREFSHWAGIAAVVLVAFLLFYLSPLDQREPTSALEKYTTLADQQTIILSDQSSIVLSPNSHIEVRYSESARELHLRKGQIFLTVIQDVRRPFRVITDRGVVRVIGTQFAVQQMADDLKITVVEGLVGLLKPDSNSADQKPMLVLSKNQQVLYSEALKGIAPTPVDAERATSWTKGRMIFDGTPLAEVTAALNQHLSMPILIANPELEARRIVGAISVKDARAAAASLASITGAEIEEAPNKQALILRSMTEELRQ